MVIEGQFDCGKSTLANAFKDLFDGTAVNVNVSSDDRLTFQLGMALCYRYVIMDYVGQLGMCNLNNTLRDCLDGLQDVVLERKGKDPLNHKFPCGIITTNQKNFPAGLERRWKRFKLTPHETYVKAHRSIFIAIPFDWKALLVRKYNFNIMFFVVRRRKKYV